MKKVILCVLTPLLLTACGGSQYLPTEELRAMKPACAGGDAAVCADIGHTIRQDRAESAYLAKTAE